MTALFWMCLFLLAYPLFLYPALLAALRGKIPPHTATPERALPFVSMLVSVHNEEAVILQKIENFQNIAYPRDRLELLVISDRSDDGTETLVEASPDKRVRLLRQDERRGKTSALNRGAAEAEGNILFFTDADSMLRPDCLARLVACFADPQVGLVSGRSIYRDNAGRETPASLYRQYEEWIKEREGALYGIAGADGAVYAMRRDLYAPLPPHYINDLAHPVLVVLAGKKAVALPDAVVTEPENAPDSGREFARQTRIMTQSWRIFFAYAGPLARGGRWGFLWQFVSHKVLRWLALPLAVTAACASTPFLVLLLCSLPVIAAGYRYRGGAAPRAAWLFALQSAAAMNGLYHFCKGEAFVTWAPRGR